MNGSMMERPEPEAVTITARCPFCEQVERHRGTGSFIQPAVQWLVEHVVEKHRLQINTAVTNTPPGVDLDLGQRSRQSRRCWFPGCDQVVSQQVAFSFSGVVPTGAQLKNYEVDQELGRAERNLIALLLQHYDDRHAALFATMTDITADLYGGYSL